MPHSNDIQMMINHVNTDEMHKYSDLTPQTQSRTQTPTQAQAQAQAETATTSTSSTSLSYDSLCLLLLHRDPKEMRHLRQLLRQHLTWHERFMEWSKFIVNIVVAVIAVVVGIQTLQSRVTSVQTAVDALTGSVNQVSSNVEKLSTSIKQSEQDVKNLQNDAAGLNHTIIGINGQLYDVQALSAQLAYNVTKLNVSQAVQQVQSLDIRINLLTNQSIVWNHVLINAQTQLQQQNISTYTQLNQLATTSQQQISSLVSSAQTNLNSISSTSQQQITSLVTSARTNLTSYIDIAPTMVTQLLQQQNQSIQQNLNAISADIRGRARSVSFCGYSTKTTGAAGGYPGSVALCRTACRSSTARVCLASDIFFQVQSTGFMLPSSSEDDLARVSSFQWIPKPQTGNGNGNGNGNNQGREIGDCNSWSSADDNHANAITVGTSARPNVVTCSEPYAFACCDYVQ